ncbi:unnamed protein product, partial [Ectocarpus sp. 4 AP-2014]
AHISSRVTPSLRPLALLVVRDCVILAQRYIYNSSRYLGLLCLFLAETARHHKPTPCLWRGTRRTRLQNYELLAASSAAILLLLLLLLLLLMLSLCIKDGLL